MLYDIYGKKKPIEIDGFKSKLEFIANKWLTEEAGLIVQYEPFTFKTKKGNYTPDFYCKESNQYFECKPTHESGAWELYKQFSIDKRRQEEKTNDFFLLSPNGISGFENNQHDLTDIYSPKENYIFYCDCSKCGKKSFHTGEGIYGCRHCKKNKNGKDQAAFSTNNLIDFSNYYKKFYNRNREWDE